jgi:hypothetical protein
VTPVHFHLALNHFPVMGLIIGFLVLVWGFIGRSDEPKKIALGIFIVVALVSIPVYLTGNPTHHAVMLLPGVSEHIIEEHHDAARFALGSTSILGAASLLGLWISRRSNQLPAWSGNLVLVLAILTIAIMARTANLGGQIRHTEIRSSASQ